MGREARQTSVSSHPCVKEMMSVQRKLPAICRTRPIFSPMVYWKEEVSRVNLELSSAWLRQSKYPMSWASRACR